MRTACLLLIACLAGPLAACGGETSAPFEPEWRESKPGAALGRIRAAIVERPGPDRAVIEARWENRSGAEGCALELVVPEGVMVLEGERMTPLAADEPAGSATWLVEFPSGRALDAVLRLCRETEHGLQAAETSVRLTDG